MPTPARFHEEQPFRQPWFWLLVGGIVVLQWWGFIQQIVFGRPWGNRPAPDWMMIVLWVTMGIGLPLFMWYLRLIVDVTDDQVSINFRPLSKRTIDVADVDTVESRTYSPLREFGGWGIRGWGDRKAYSVGGNRGAELTLTDGRKVLLGSQRADELAVAMEAARTDR